MMKLFLQILLALGTLAFLAAIAQAFTGKVPLFTPGGWLRGAMALWMLLIATRLTYLEQK
jgi:hypothetical protein